MFFIYLIIISLPLYLVRFSVFGFNTNVLDILLFLFVLFVLIDNFYLNKNSLKERALLIYSDVKKSMLPAALILIGLIASTFKSGDISVSAGIIKSWFVLPILLFVGSVSVISADNQKRSVLRAWFLGGYSVALIGLFYYLSDYMTYDGRLAAFFSSPNNLAMFLAPSFIIGVWFVFRGTDRFSEFLCNMTGVVLIGFVIFATKSLGGFAAILLSFVFLSVKFLKLKENKKLSVLLVAIFLMGVTLYLFYAHDFGDRSSLMSRVMIWKSAVKILSDNLVLGIGPGMFQENYLSYQKYFTPYLEWAVPHPHNIFLAFWLQSGLAGLGGFLWLITSFFKNVWKNKDDNVVLLCGALMIYFLAHGLIDATYWRNDLAVMFWMIIALATKR